MTRVLTHFFEQPFPYLQKRWQIIVVPTFNTAFIAMIVLCMGVRLINFRSLVWMVGGYTVVAAISIYLVVYCFSIPFRRFFDVQHWTKGKHFLSVFFMYLVCSIGGALYDYGVLRNVYYDLPSEFSFFQYLCFYLRINFLTGMIPTIFGYLWLRNQRLRNNLQEKEEQSQKLKLYIASKEESITLTGKTNDSLTLLPEELLYMESVGNYVRIHYRRNGQVSDKTLRMTLQQMGELLSDYPFFVRCHRAFIVNVSHIEKIKGLKLWLKSTEVKLPISKTYRGNLPQ